MTTAPNQTASTGTSVSILVPAFNEGERIGRVLSVLAGHPDVGEIIVIDDCSRDDTARVAEAVAATTPGLRLIRQPVNGGKTRALATGLAAARGDLIGLIDADLEGLTRADITRLIAPVALGRAAMSISLRGNAPAPWRWIGLDYISGERVMPRALLEPAMEGLDRLPRFGFEVHLNRMVLASRLPIAVVPWPEVKSPMKAKKHGLWTGIRGDVGMIRDMVQTVPATELMGQILGLRRLRVPGR
jgi:glycosyltransferase involved in cell wall biosynthesis